MLMEQIEGADKVVIGRRWFALVGEQLVAGPMLTTSRMQLVDGAVVTTGYVSWQPAELSRDAARALRMLHAGEGFFTNPADRGLTEQQRADAAALTRGTPAFPFITADGC